MKIFHLLIVNNRVGGILAVFSTGTLSNCSNFLFCVMWWPHSKAVIVQMKCYERYQGTKF